MTIVVCLVQVTIHIRNVLTGNDHFNAKEVELYARVSKFTTAHH